MRNPLKPLGNIYTVTSFIFLITSIVAFAPTSINLISKIETGQPETVIAREVETDHYDLLVMGAFGHSRIRNLIIGSTTTEMIRSCKIPVLLFR